MLQLDSKTSPLAMLVRTCSQIGADPPMAAAAKSKKQATGATAPMSATPTAVADRPHSASPASGAYMSHAAAAKHHHRNHNNNYMEEPPKPAAKLNFKPYENTVLTPSTAPPMAHQNHTTHHHHNNNNNNEEDMRPKSSSSEDNGHGNGKKRKSASPRDDYHQHKSSRRSSSSASSTESSAIDPSTNPIIRSGLEVMHGSKAFCPPPSMAAHSPYKPATDALAAFRHTYLPGAPPWIPAAVSLAAAAAAASKPSPTSAECKDPLCGGPSAGCGQQQHAAAAAAALAFASQYHPMMAVGGCPAGCTQCDHQRYMTSLMAAMPAFYAAPPVAARPYTCSWVIPGGGHSPLSTAAEAAAVPTLCGKSFGTSDELLQHIRTHTSGSAAMGGTAGPMSPTSAAAFTAYNSHLSRHLFHHHHPSAVAAYDKLSPPLSMMPPSPYSAFNPTAAYCYPPPTSVAAAAAAAYHHHHSLYSPARSDTSAATVSR